MEFLQNLKAAQDAGIPKEEFLQIWKKEKEETLLKLKIKSQAPHADENLICKQIEQIHQEVIGVKEELRVLRTKFITNAENETIKQQSGAVSGDELRNEIQKLEHLISSGFETHNRSLKSFVTQEIDALKASLEDKFDFFSETSSDVVDCAGNIDSEMASQSMDKKNPREKTVDISSSQHHEEQDHIEITNEGFIDMKSKTLPESTESDKRVSETDSGCLKTKQAHQQEKGESQTTELGLELNTVDMTNKTAQESSDSVSETDSGHLKTDQGHEQAEEKSQSAELDLGLNTTEETNKIQKESNGSDCKVSEADQECLGALEDCQHDEEQTQITELSLKTVDVAKKAAEGSSGSGEGDQKVEEDQQPEKDPLEDISFDLVDDYQRVPEENTDSESRESDSEILGEERSDVQDNDQSEENFQTENVGQDLIVTKHTSSPESIGFDVSSSTIDSESSGVYRDQQQEKEKVLEEAKDLNTSTEMFKVPVESSDLDASTQEIAEACTRVHLGDQIEEINLQKQEQTMKGIGVHGQSLNEGTDSERGNQTAAGESNEEELITFQNRQESQEDPVLEVQSLESTDSYHTALEGSTDSETGSNPADPESPDEFVALEDDQQTDTKMQTGKESEVAIGMTNKELPESSSSDACTQGMEQKCVGDQCETKKEDNKFQPDLAVAYVPKMNKETSNENENENIDSGDERRQETDEESPADNVLEQRENCENEFLPIDDTDMSNEKGKENAVPGVRGEKLNEGGKDERLGVLKEHFPMDAADTDAGDTDAGYTSNESSNGDIDSDATNQTKDKKNSRDALEHEECLQKEHLPLECASDSNVKGDGITDSDAGSEATDVRDSDNTLQDEEILKKECMSFNDADMSNVKCDDRTKSGARGEARNEEGPDDTIEHEKECPPIDTAQMSHEPLRESTDSDASSQTKNKEKFENALEHEERLQKENLPMKGADKSNVKSDEDTDSDASYHATDQRDSGSASQHEKNLKKEHMPKAVADMDNESSDEYTDSDGSNQANDEGDPGNTLGQEKSFQPSDEEGTGNAFEHEESLQKECLPTDSANISNVKHNASSESGAWSEAIDKRDHEDTSEDVERLQKEHLLMDVADENNESSNGRADPEAISQTKNESCPDDVVQHEESLQKENRPKDIGDVNNESSDESSNSDASSQTTDEGGPDNTLEHEESLQKEGLFTDAADMSNVKCNDSTESGALIKALDEEGTCEALEHEKGEDMTMNAGDMSNESLKENSDSYRSSQSTEGEGTGDVLEHEHPSMDGVDKSNVKCNDSTESEAGSQVTSEKDLQDTLQNNESSQKEYLAKDAGNESSNEGTDSDANSQATDEEDSDDVLQHEECRQQENLPKDVGDMNVESSDESSDSDTSGKVRDDEVTGDTFQHEESLAKEGLFTDAADMSNVKCNESTESGALIKALDEEGPYEALEHEKGFQREDLSMNAGDMSNESSKENSDSDGNSQSTEEEGTGDVLEHEHPSMDGADKSNVKCNDSTESEAGSQVTSEQDLQDTLQNNESSQKEYLAKGAADTCNESSNEGTDSEASSQATDEEDSDDVLQHEEYRQQEYLHKDVDDMNVELCEESSDSDASGKEKDEEGTVDTFHHEESLQKEYLPMDDNNKNTESTKEKFDSDPGSNATDDEGSDVTVLHSQDNQKMREVFQKEDESMDFVQVYHKTAEEGVKLEQEKKAESSVEKLSEPQDGQQIEDQLPTELLNQDYVVVNNKARQDRVASLDSVQATDLPCLRNYHEDQCEEEKCKKELTLNTEDVKKKEPDESIDNDESVSKTEDGGLNACQVNSQQCEKVLKDDLGLHEKYTDSDDMIQSVSPLYAIGCPESLHQEGILQDQEMAVSSAYVHTEACTENTSSDVSNQTVEKRNPDETMPSMSSQHYEEDPQSEEMSFEFVDLNPKAHAEEYDLEANRHTRFTESTTRDAKCDLQEGQQPKVKTGVEEKSYISTIMNTKASQDITGSGGTIRTMDPGWQCAIQEGQIEREKAQKQEVGYAKTQERTNSGVGIQGIDPKNSGSQQNDEGLSKKRNENLFNSSPKPLTSVQRKDQRSAEDHDDGQQPKEKLQTEEMNYSSQKLANSEATKYTAKLGEVKGKSFQNFSEDKFPEISNQILTKLSTENERPRIGDSDSGFDPQFQDASNKPSVALPLSSACKTMDSSYVKISTSYAHKEADIAKDTDDAMEKYEPILGKCTQQFEVTNVKTMLLTQNPFFTHPFYIHPKPFKVRLRLSFNSRGRFDVRLLVAEGKCDRLTKLPMVLNGSVSILNESSGRYTKLCEINNEEFAKPNQHQEIGLNLRVALKTCRRVYHDVTYHTLISRGFIFHNGMRFKCEIEAYEKTPTTQ